MSSSSWPSSTSMPPLMKDEEPRNWVELPSELTLSILLRLGAMEILDSAQKVCREWRRVCKDPSMWRKIDMRNLKLGGRRDLDFASMCRHAVDRSERGLVKIKIGNFGSGSILNYIADRSSNLRSLGLAMCYPTRINDFELAVAKLPLLEELVVSHMWIRLDLKKIGHSCPRLKTLKLNCSGGFMSLRGDKAAIEIAESMTQLHHLHLFENSLTNTGLNAILDGCPHLELLDLRQCFNINLVGDLEKRCSERIKDLKRPNDDSTADFPFDSPFWVFWTRY